MPKRGRETEAPLPDPKNDHGRKSDPGLQGEPSPPRRIVPPFQQIFKTSVKMRCAP